MSISENQYRRAIEEKDASQAIINQYHKEQYEAFQKRLKENPIFTDEELRYSANLYCPCGHGMAYPKGCGPNHYWDCSAILKGIADPEIKHEAQLPFVAYDIKGESEHRGTTRGNVIPPKK